MRNLNHELLHGNAETLVLALLAEGEGYGYQIRKDLAERSQQYFQFAFGRLYPLLRGLETRGLAKATWVHNHSARRRKQYVLTRKGLDALKVRKEKWKEFSKAMDQVLNK